MFIDSIIIHNYRAYKGHNKISFKPDKKNIFLIAGNNGFGKTTFLTSLVWCLYGKLMVDVDEKFRRDINDVQGYKNYARQSLHKNLANIKLPSTITTIGESAFESCVSLRNINFPSSITEIGIGAFQGCYILSYADLQNTKITEVKQQTFYDCSSLKTVLLSNAMKYPSAMRSTQSSMSSASLSYNKCLEYSFVDQ